ncbi:MAG: ComF family protein [Planctomycetales bacterium]|nr:ComF family protein [Planctomycetales bacterium]MBN8626581.1 ComF family protein [Planctomycetota bacterium]
MARLLIERYAEQWEATEFDLVVPIPMHWFRRAIQGHNGPDLTATLVAKRLGIVDYPRLLVRRRRTRPQAGLTPPQRRDNVHNAFALRNGYRVEGAKVLLIDDILTTGATCSEAARTLKRAGATTVAVAVLGRAQSEV